MSLALLHLQNCDADLKNLQKASSRALLTVYLALFRQVPLLEDLGTGVALT